MYFSSTARWRGLKENCDEVVKQLSGTRWSEHADAVGALVPIAKAVNKFKKISIF